MADEKDLSDNLKKTSDGALALAKSLALTKPGLTDFASKVPVVSAKVSAISSGGIPTPPS